MALGNRNSTTLNVTTDPRDLSQYLVNPTVQQAAPMVAHALPQDPRIGMAPRQQYPSMPPQQGTHIDPYNPPNGPNGGGWKRGGGAFASGGPTYGLSSIPQLGASQGSSGSGVPQVPPSNTASPYVSSGTAGNSPFVASIGSNGLPTGAGTGPSTNGSPIVTNYSNIYKYGTNTPTAAQTNPTPAASSSTTPKQSQYVVVNGQWWPVQTIASKRGGRIDKMAGGGIPTSEALSPWYARSEERQMVQPEGLIHSMGAGRTDIHPINVPSGSYVLPSDIVSGLGEGNTLSGSAVIDRMLHTNPYGIEGSKVGHGGIGMPHPPAPYHQSNPDQSIMQASKKGGKIKSRGGSEAGHTAGKPVPIVIAGGEFLVHPQTIIKKFGSLEKGHAALDAFVRKTREDTAKTLRKLPGPKK